MMPYIEGITGAKFSEDKQHRFALWRIWDWKKPLVLFIGLNPSRAHEFYNDHTITRCIAFSKQWGYGGMMFGNLFTLKSPKPAKVKADPEAACHPRNNEWIIYMSQLATTVVFCWGDWDFIEKRKYAVMDLVRQWKQPMCFGLTKNGSPKHPARLAGNTQLVNFPC